MVNFFLLVFDSLQGIVSRECSSRRVPLHISNVAHQLFLAGN